MEGERWREEEGGGFTGVREGNGGRRTTSASCAGESARGSPDEEASAWRMVGGEDRGNDDDRLQRGQEREGLPGRGGLGVMDGGGRAEDSGNDGDRLRRGRDRERLPGRGGLGVAEGRGAARTVAMMRPPAAAGLRGSTWIWRVGREANLVERQWEEVK